MLSLSYVLRFLNFGTISLKLYELYVNYLLCFDTVPWLIYIFFKGLHRNSMVIFNFNIVQ